MFALVYLEYFSKSNSADSSQCFGCGQYFIHSKSGMISFTPQQQYRLYSKPTDMRKSFDGLCGIVRNELNRDAVSV
jgi:hypothetical protein